MVCDGLTPDAACPPAHFPTRPNQHLLRCSKNSYALVMTMPAEMREQDMPTGAVPTILEAIVRKRCLDAVYNRSRITLAPHILYTKHDALHVDAVVLERDGKPPRELKLGTYRLSGLGAIDLTDRGFAPVDSFDPLDQRYQGVTLIEVDRA